MRSFTTILWTTVALVALAACSGNMATPGAALPSNVSQSHTSDLSPQATEVLGRVAIRTSGGFFVTAIGGGGGPTEPNCNPGWVALHENATRIGPWETFKLVRVPITVAGPRKYAFRTDDGSYITAVNGSSIGDQSGTNPSSQLITNSTSAGAPRGVGTSFQSRLRTWAESRSKLRTESTRHRGKRRRLQQTGQCAVP